MAVWYCFVEIEYTVILRETSNGPLLRHRHYQYPHHLRHTERRHQVFRQNKDRVLCAMQWLWLCIISSFVHQLLHFCLFKSMH